MILGLVGSEAAKFTPAGEQRAREFIRQLIAEYDASAVCSGACHLGGIDIWAVEEAKRAEIGWIEYPPATRAWSTGYAPRNRAIAEHSNVVCCITVDRLPAGYKGMRFPLCYHCGTAEHVKSGGCWTVKYARGLGKSGLVHVVANEE